MNKKDRLVLEYLCEKYGPDVIEEGFAKKLMPALTAGLIAYGGIAGINKLTHNAQNNDSDLTNSPATETTVSLEDIIPHYNELVQSVKEYMNWAVNCNGHDYSEIEIRPETLVELCYQYKYDLPMLLSALHLESCFGITPRAKRTGSPCSIGCWDNGKNKIYYDDQNEAVEDYIKIMQNNFIRGRKYSDAFADGNLVNGLGLRYASNKKYEPDLRYMRARAIKKFPELEYESYYI